MNKKNPTKKNESSRSIYKVTIDDYTTKDKDSDVRHERLTKVKKIFGITIYRREYAYDCDDHEKRKELGYK